MHYMYVSKPLESKNVKNKWKKGGTVYGSELQLIGGIEDNSKILNFHENIYCDPSLEPPRRDGSNDGSLNMFFFLWRNMENDP